MGNSTLQIAKLFLSSCFGIRMLRGYWNICQSNRVEPFSIFFPPSVKFCFTSKVLKILDTSFYNVDLVSHQLRDTAGSYLCLFWGHVGGESGLRTKATTMNGWWTCGKRVSSLVHIWRGVSISHVDGCLHLGIDAGESAIMFKSEPAIQFVCMVTVPFLCGVFIFVYRSPEQDMWVWAFKSRQQSAFILDRRIAINASHTGFLAPHVCISVSLYCCKCHMASTVTVSLVPSG